MFNEHHFLGYGGPIANPATLLAAAAARTSKIRLGPSRHHFFGEEAHGFCDRVMRNAAKIEGGRQDVKVIVLGRVVYDPDAVLRVAVKIPPLGQHAFPVIDFR